LNVQDNAGKQSLGAGKMLPLRQRHETAKPAIFKSSFRWTPSNEAAMTL